MNELIIGVFILPIALLIQFLGKFFFALFIQARPGEKRISSATKSTFICSFMAMFASGVLALIHPQFDSYFWPKASALYLGFSALTDLVIIAPLKKPGVQVLVPYLIVDIIAAMACGACTLTQCSD